MSEEDLGRNEDVAVALRRLWFRLHQYSYVDCIQKSGVALGNTHVVDITTNAKN